MREIIFYTTPSGKSPVQDFLDSLSAKESQKVTWVLNLLESLPMVLQEYFKKLQNSDGIWEIGVKQGNNAFRLLGFLDKGKLVILTNGFARKSQKTPPQEIALAEQRKHEYQERAHHE
jgi:phage-related protein